MSTDQSGAAPAPSQDLGQLQFDRALPAEGGETATNCVACGATLTSFYSINTQSICSNCIDQLRAGIREPGVTQLARAILYGLGAAAAGTGIYYAILAISGYEIGWIAVIVGWMVGKAVQKGGEARGGWKLQTIAIALTYCSIVASYIPLVLRSADTATPTFTFTVFLLFFSLFIPFLQGFESVIGLFIIAIGLYEAWKINRRTRYEITGPHQVKAA